MILEFFIIVGSVGAFFLLRNNKVSPSGNTGNTNSLVKKLFSKKVMKPVLAIILIIVLIMNWDSITSMIVKFLSESSYVAKWEWDVAAISENIDLYTSLTLIAIAVAIWHFFFRSPRMRNTTSVNYTTMICITIFAGLILWVAYMIHGGIEMVSGNNALEAKYDHCATHDKLRSMGDLTETKKTVKFCSPAIMDELGESKPLYLLRKGTNGRSVGAKIAFSKSFLALHGDKLTGTTAEALKSFIKIKARGQQIQFFLNQDTFREYGNGLEWIEVVITPYYY